MEEVNMQTYPIDLTNAVVPDHFSVAAKVKNGGEVVDLWVIAATQEGFVGYPIGFEARNEEAAVENLPGYIWEDVDKVEPITEPTDAFHKIKKFHWKAWTQTEGRKV